MTKYNRKWQHLYSARWTNTAKAFLVRNPLCVYCDQLGRTTAATVVDHIVPHKGDYNIFWDPNNWQALCKHCHDSVKAREEFTGSLPGCDVDGMPLDKNHGWNKD